MPRAKIVVLVVVLVAVGIQFLPSGRSNPPVTAEIEAPPDVKAILVRSCYDCHSNETHWPWYSRIAPVSWVLVRDVNEGREHVDFSRWGEYTQKEKSHRIDHIVELVSKGEMPLKAYLLLHSDAKISAGDVATLKRWAEGTPAETSLEGGPEDAPADDESQEHPDARTHGD